MASADGSFCCCGIQTRSEWRPVHSLRQTTVRKPAEFIRCHGDTMLGWMTRVQLLHVMSALIWHQLVRSRLQPAQNARKFIIKPRRPCVQEGPPRTLCAPFLSLARNDFSHIRLHRLSKGRPDSLVNPILLRQPWSAWYVGRRSVSVDPSPSANFLALVAWTALSSRLADESPSPTCPRTGGRISRCLEPVRTVARLWGLATFLLLVSH